MSKPAKNRGSNPYKPNTGKQVPVDSVHANVYPCLVDSIKGLVDRLLRARIAGHLGKKRGGGIAMNSCVGVKR